MTDGVVSDIEVIASLIGIFIFFALALVLIIREQHKREKAAREGEVKAAPLQEGAPPPDEDISEE